MTRAPLAWMLLWLLALAAVPAAAGAARPASDTERAAVAAGAGYPPECSVVQISTVDETWASLASTNASGCTPADGTVALQRRDDRWEQVQAGPASRESCSSTAFDEVPREVAVDLGLCREVVASKHVYFPIYRDGEQVLAKRPSRIGVGAKGLLFKLRWSRWSRSVAIAKGTYDIAGFAGEPGTGYRGPVRVRLYGIRTCHEGTRVYTRMQIIPTRKRDRGRRLPFRKGERWTSCEWLEEDGVL